MELENKYGTTSSSVAFATELAIQHNIKVLLISTSLNDSTIRDSFWPAKKKNHFSLFSGSIKMKEVETSGIIGLDRMIRSNKLTPEIITDYAKIVLTNRLEILPGVEGDENQYNLVKEKYSQIISLAGKYYDMVIVDLDNKVGRQTEMDILNTSDIGVALVPQRAKEIEKKMQEMNKEKTEPEISSPYSKPMRKYPTKYYVVTYVFLILMVVLIIVWSVSQISEAKGIGVIESKGVVNELR